MNTPESVGETSSNSCSSQENGDSATECERPLKKARFPWEVKGKYHLKNETSENKSISNTDETNNSNSSLEIESNKRKIPVHTDQNLDIIGDYLMQKDFNTSDSIVETEESPSTSSSAEKSLSTNDNNSGTSRNDNCNSGASNNTRRWSSVNNPLKHVEDELLIRWQSRQIAKCYIDNTINRLLDNWKITTANIDEYNLDDEYKAQYLDVAEIVNNYPGDNNTVENEGILMAISAHGLQNASNSSDNSTIHSETSSSKNLDPTNPPSNGDGQKQNLKRKEDQTEHSNETPVTYTPEASSSSSQSYSENVQINQDYERDDFDDILNDHYDFMDAAVSYAIQCKGLTSLGTDG